ncbi:hypothetical protein BGZ54_001591, partial [Gamsiella multidivaricata]
NSLLDFVIGLIVSLISSIMNAAGLNLLKLDHDRNSARGQERQRHECGRPMWHVGLYLYVGSQLAGSTIALNFLKAQWVAPLGSAALIFNFIFAKILVGTRITKKDVVGTVVVTFSVVWIVIFGGMNSGADVEGSLTIAELKALFSRVVFIIYFSVFNIIILTLLSLGLYVYWAITLDDESGRLRKQMKARLIEFLGTNRLARCSGWTFAGGEGLEAEARDLRLRKIVAMIMATSGGLIASQTLLLAKSGVKLLASTAAGQNQFLDMLSFFILFVLVLTAILQVYCLNTALKLYDSVMVVPMFYGYYAAFGLINSTIYLNQYHNYQPWVLVLILLGIGVLIVGVHMLSAPKVEIESSASTTSSTRDEELNDADDDDDDKEQGGSRVADGRASICEKDGDKVRFNKKISDDSVALMIRKSSASSEVMETIGRDNIAHDVDGPKSTGAGARGSDSSVNMAYVLIEGEQDPGFFQLHGRESSLSQTTYKAFDLRERRASVDRGREGRSSTVDAHRQTLPKIDTAFVTRGRSETRRVPMSAWLSAAGPRPMSPSEFRAQYTDSPFPIKPKHLQDRVSGLGGPRSASSAPIEGERRPRWAVGGARIDQVFGDLNPFKFLRRSSMDSSLVLPASPRQVHDKGYLRCHPRCGSCTGLPSEWEEPNRMMRHSTLFGEHGRASSAGSWVSSRSASPAPSSCIITPDHSRRQSTHEGASGAWVTNVPIAYKPGEPLSPTGVYTAHGGEGSPQEPQGYQNHYFTGTPPPISALAGGECSMSSSQLPPTHHQHHRSQSSSPTIHRRQLSFTTKNGRGLAAVSALSASSPTHAETASFASSTGTFGTVSTSGVTGLSTLPLNVRHQLQHLQQHQHYPTSSLQHSITTSSISTIGDTTPALSTLTSLVQLADESVFGPIPVDPKKRGVAPESMSLASLWMGMTPS